MLPEFPQIKVKLQEVLRLYLENLVRQEPLLSQIRHVRMFEGNGLSTQDPSGTVDRSSFKELRGDMVISREEIIQKGICAYLESINNVAQQLQKAQAQMAFQKVIESSEKIGNVVDGRGRPFDFEMFYEGAKKVQIEFDDDGNPHFPTLFVGPELGLKIKELIPEWLKNDEYNERMRILIDEKRKEWNDRESNRKLVD